MSTKIAITRNVKIRKFLLCVIWCFVFGLTFYRLIDWVARYHLLSYSLTTNSVPQPIKNFPDVTICNINIVRGTALIPTTHINQSLDVYENFVDFINGRLQNISVLHATKYSILNLPYIKILEKNCHKLETMLKTCIIGNTICTWKDFVKRVLPFGVCYTLETQRYLPKKSQIHLVLDPEEYDYLIPNKGFVGFRVMLHDKQDSLWLSYFDALNVGQKFQTVIHSSNHDRLHCNRQALVLNFSTSECVDMCVEEFIQSRCHCRLYDNRNQCSLFQLINCNFNLDTIYNCLRLDNCSCYKSCHTTDFSVISVTQSLTFNLFAKLEVLRESHSQDFIKIIEEGLQIQRWAFLREANYTAFQMIGKLTTNVLSLFQSMNNSLHLVNLIDTRWKHMVKYQQNLTKRCNQSLSIISNSLHDINNQVNTAHRKLLKLFAIKLNFMENFHLKLAQYFFSNDKHLLLKFDKIISSFSSFEVELLSPDIDLCVSAAFVIPSQPTFVDLCKSLKQQLYLAKMTLEDVTTKLGKVRHDNEELRRVFSTLNDDSFINEYSSASRHATNKNLNKAGKLISGGTSNFRGVRNAEKHFVTLKIIMADSIKHDNNVISFQTMINPASSLIGIILSSLSAGLLLRMMLKICFKKRKAPANVENTPIVTKTTQSSKIDVTAILGNLLLEESEVKWFGTNEFVSSADCDNAFPTLRVI